MILSEKVKGKIWAEFMSNVSSREEEFGQIDKHQIKATIDAIDQWIENNLVSFNSALSEFGRTQLTQKQKLELFIAVLKQKREVS